MLSAPELVELLGLEPLPVEGGLYRRTYLASEWIPQAALPARYRSRRPFSSAIYYLLTAEPGSFSALHRLAGDEIYHFYLGDPVEMLLLYPGVQGEGARSEVLVLGQDLAAGERVQQVVPRGVWQGSRLAPGGRLALLGTTMAPAFDVEDFEIGSRQGLALLYPEQDELIGALTR